MKDICKMKQKKNNYLDTYNYKLKENFLMRKTGGEADETDRPELVEIVHSFLMNSNYE